MEDVKEVSMTDVTGKTTDYMLTIELYNKLMDSIENDKTWFNMKSRIINIRNIMTVIVK